VKKIQEKEDKQNHVDEEQVTDNLQTNNNIEDISVDSDKVHFENNTTDHFQTGMFMAIQFPSKKGKSTTVFIAASEINGR